MKVKKSFTDVPASASAAMATIEMRLPSSPYSNRLCPSSSWMNERRISNRLMFLPCARTTATGMPCVWRCAGHARKSAYIAELAITNELAYGSDLCAHTVATAGIRNGKCDFVARRDPANRTCSLPHRERSRVRRRVRAGRETQHVRSRSITLRAQVEDVTGKRRVISEVEVRIRVARVAERGRSTGARQGDTGCVYHNRGR